MKKVVFILFCILCIAISGYPLIYFLSDEPINILKSKPESLLQSVVWRTGFYTHIGFGGLALLVGWSQFVQSWRRKYLVLHRRIGWVYIVAVFLSGIAGFYVAFYTSPSKITNLGFIFLAIVWLSTTALALKSILQKNITAHEKWMIYSYAACFAAVSLRIQLPILIALLGSFAAAYQVVAWSCWVPNLFVAYYINKR